MLNEGDRLVTGRRAGGTAGIVGAQQLHQGRGELLCPPAGPLGFESVPVALWNRQQPVQGLGLAQRLLGPVSVWRRAPCTLCLLCHWTPMPPRIHPGVGGLRADGSAPCQV